VSTSTREGDLQLRVRAAADAAGVDVFAHAIDLETGREVGCDGDKLVVTASVFKVAVLLEYVRQADAGEVDPRRQVTITDSERVLGPTGLSVFTDESTWSLRDLATSMITVSDNTATDVVLGVVGVDRVNATLRELGLDDTVILGGCEAIFDDALDELGAADFAELDAVLKDRGDRVAELRICTPSLTNRSTARESAALLSMIWRDAAATPAACAEARRILGLQVWPHRLTSGFPDDSIAVSGKTGTIGVVRNEVGVVEYPSGQRYAVAVFTRSRRFAYRQPTVDALIGSVGRALVDELATA
jgi:beta-lactamase class A